MHFETMFKGLLYLSVVSILSVIEARAVDGFSLDSLVNDTTIWKSNRKLLTNDYPDISWEKGDKDDEFVYENKGLNLWGQSVHHLNLSQSQGRAKSLKITLVDQGTALFMRQKDFKLKAGRWNKLISEQLNSKGVRLPNISYGEVDHIRVAWNRGPTVVVLSANIGLKPDRLELIYYQRDLGLKRMKLTGQQVGAKQSDEVSKKVSGSDLETEDAEDEEDVIEDDGFAPREVKAEIKAKIKEIKGREAPNGVSKEVQEAVNLLNVYRFLSKVPFDVKADKKMVAAANDAASICNKKGELSHGFGHSTDKCNLAMNGGRMSMAGSVTQYMNDAGANNREKRGHRRWCINHKMGETGFGIEGDYSAMYSMDQSDRGTRKNYSYPGHDFYPVDYLHGNGWSYHIVGGSAPKDCDVRVWKLKVFEEKAPSWSNEPDGREFKVAFKYIYNDTIVFEPASDAITRKGTYLVRLKGGGLKEQYLVHLY